MCRLLRILLCSLLVAATANAEATVKDCPTNTNYTRGSTFEANLDALLLSLPAAAASSGYATNVTGAAPDQVYGLAQCRADVDASTCRSCLDGLASDMASICPGQKDAMLFSDTCLLRHAHASFVGAAETVGISQGNTQNATNPELFMTRLGALMKNLTELAAYTSPLKFAVAKVSATSFENIYGMVQCTRDLADDDCNRCLVDAVLGIPSCCNGRQGGWVIYRSCSIRFEVYPFYNAQAAEAAMSPGGGLNNVSDHSVPGSAGSGGHTRGTALRVAIPVAIAVALLLLLLVAVFYYIRRKNRKPSNHVPITSARRGNEEIGRSEFLQYDLSTLQAATDNFSEQNRLGHGAFGPVYKGKLQNGKEIAVKRLSKTSQQGHVEMENEVALVANVQHKNLVRLLGYCIEKPERLLVYEFLSNRSLDKILYGPARQRELSWKQRYKIIYGIGRGLMYLHEDSRLKIIHRDLKPGNILLDENMNPKISDFGLAKLFNMDLSEAITKHVAGTLGYMAPEYVLQGNVSAKSDVFSYGVLVLEVITSRRPSEELIKFVWGHWSQGNLPPLLDSCPADEPAQQEMLMCIHIGLLCVQDDPQLRPRMADVVNMLNSRSITLAPPSMPVFAATGETPQVATVPPVPSNNEASISEMEPR